MATGESRPAQHADSKKQKQVTTGVSKPGSPDQHLDPKGGCNYKSGCKK